MIISAKSYYCKLNAIFKMLDQHSITMVSTACAQFWVRLCIYKYKLCITNIYFVVGLDNIFFWGGWRLGEGLRWCVNTQKVMMYS